MEPQEFSRQIQYIRSARVQAVIEQNQIAQQKTQHQGTITSFNASSGLYTVRLETGSTIYAKSLTSSGSESLGSNVSVYISRGGMPMIDWL